MIAVMNLCPHQPDTYQAVDAENVQINKIPNVFRMMQKQHYRK